MADSNDALKAVEALCRLLEEMLQVPGMGPPQVQMLTYRLQSLRLGCEQIRKNQRAFWQAAAILEEKKS
jgi:hypothetical protein